MRLPGEQVPARPRQEDRPLHSPPIADLALLSDCQGAAIVASDGTIAWWCAPRFDSRSIFGRLLDPDAGHWRSPPSAPSEVTRRYRPDTMVLETTSVTSEGTVRVSDALALGAGSRGHEIGMDVPHALVRVVEGVEGSVEVAMELAPRPEYGMVVPEFRRDGDVIVSVGGPDLLVLRCDVPVTLEASRIVLTHRLEAGERIAFSLTHGAPSDGLPSAVDAIPALADTADAWRSWADGHEGYTGYAQDRVARSAMVLQALTYAPTGAIVAAATTSLPEVPGGEDNWDYRFAWLRDASLTMHALSVAACPDEAVRNFGWMARAAVGAREDGDVQIVFGVEGERDLTERELPHLSGWRGSRPVRVGNAAWTQTQLDVYGEVLASAHLLRDQLDDMDDMTRRFLSSVADLAADRWSEPDSGIWEARDEERHYLSSKVMCWVALDRAIDLAALLGADDARRARWARERERVRETVLREGWHEGVGAYTGALGSDHLDASVLLMPLVGFLPAADPRMRTTIEALERELAESGLLRRWTGATDGAFVICSFWLADCLARAGEVDRARAVFDTTCHHANDLGLFSEEIDPDSGELLGNFPQGLSHVGLIGAAWSIDRASGRVADDGAASGR